MLLISAVRAQSTLINATVSADCSAAANAQVGALVASCGGTNAPLLLATQNPVNAIPVANDPTFLPQYCSSGCKSQVQAFSTATQICGTQRCFSGLDLGCTDIQAEYTAYSNIFCIQSQNKYCYYEIYNSLAASGYVSGNSETLANAFIRLSLNASLACTTCATSFALAVKTNAAAFGAYGAIIASSLTQIDNTCKVAQTTKSNAASKEGFAALLLLMTTFLY
ncbi:hypothetical protein EDD86DRAFT_274150 [Gorgonomyces haynaldii]|nr:hypothetical protein EDD86DRAFT_274150 [Gorgonomyces haynaldii]